MNVTVKQTYTDQEIILDYHKYVECTFEECTIVYHGNGPTAADECQFQDCRFDFRASASSTFSTLRSFFHGGLEQGGQARLLLDLGRVDPDDFSPNGQHGTS